jgi:hypothetical protein
MFQSTILPPSSRSISKASKKQAASTIIIHAGCLLSLLFNPEDGSTMFPQNVSELLLDYTTSHLSRQYSSPLLEPQIKHHLSLVSYFITLSVIAFNMSVWAS